MVPCEPMDHVSNPVVVHCETMTWYIVCETMTCYIVNLWTVLMAAREEEAQQRELEKHQEYRTRAGRTFEWLHTQVGDYNVSSSRINPGYES